MISVHSRCTFFAWRACTISQEAKTANLERLTRELFLEIADCRRVRVLLPRLVDFFPKVCDFPLVLWIRNRQGGTVLNSVCCTTRMLRFGISLWIFVSTRYAAYLAMLHTHMCLCSYVGADAGSTDWSDVHVLFFLIPKLGDGSELFVFLFQ